MLTKFAGTMSGCDADEMEGGLGKIRLKVDEVRGKKIKCRRKKRTKEKRKLKKKERKKRIRKDDKEDEMSNLTRSVAKEDDS